jgi:CelD/BcsL family acetyltransferase involved in cellulose biosynthesis
MEFHRALVSRAWPEGGVELLRIRAGEKPIGYLYNFLWRGWVGYYTSGFVYTDDNRLKPGLVAHWLAIERHLAAGARIYDFMAGESRYKASLGEPGPLLLDLVVEPDDPLARWAALVRRIRDRLTHFPRPPGTRGGA